MLNRLAIHKPYCTLEQNGLHFVSSSHRIYLWPCVLFQNGEADGGFDMNVREAWRHGFSGRDVVVSILDDGIERTHPDLQQNYVRTSRHNRLFFIFCGAFTSSRKI